jgi:hypothetical protein
MTESLVIRNFQWTQDSRQLWFADYNGFVKYDVETATLSKQPRIWGNAYILHERKQILAIRAYGFDIVGFDGKVQKKVRLHNLPFSTSIMTGEINSEHALSLDRRFLLYMFERQSYVIDIDKPHQPVFKLDFAPDNAIFSVNPKEIIYIGNDLEIRNLETGASRKIRMPGYDRGFYQLILPFNKPPKG